jgi:hypothetical protein
MSDKSKKIANEVIRFIRYHKQYYGKIFIDVNEIIRIRGLFKTELTGKEFNKIFEGFKPVRITLDGRKRCYFINNMTSYLDYEEDKKFTYITIPDDTTVFLSKKYGIVLTKYEESEQRLIKNMHIWKNLEFCRNSLKQSGVGKLYATLHYTMKQLLEYCF